MPVFQSTLREGIHAFTLELWDEEAVRMIRLAIDAYTENDGPLGAALDDIDNRLDQLQSEFVQAMFEAHSDEALPLQPAVQLALIARYYERIGDHAVNIAGCAQELAKRPPVKPLADLEQMTESAAGMLRDALDALLAGQTPAKAETKAFGCGIKYEKQ